MGRKAQLVTEQQFKDLLIQYILKMSDNQLEDCHIESESLINAKNGDIFNILCNILMCGDLGEINEDWSKINFDRENLYVCHKHSESTDWQLGFQTLDNGFTYVGIVAGGDWEHPIYAIIYHDGKQFRGYVPTKGNIFNPVTKSAFGNEDDEELYIKGLLALGIHVPENCDVAFLDCNFNFAEIRKDIESRIQLDGIYNKKIKTEGIDYLIQKIKDLEDKYEQQNSSPYPSHVPYDQGTGLYLMEKQKYYEIVTVYEYKHLIDIAKKLLEVGMTFEEFVLFAEKSDNVENLVQEAKKIIALKKAEEEMKRLFGEE
jgi:hypothetical protein